MATPLESPPGTPDMAAATDREGLAGEGEDLGGEHGLGGEEEGSEEGTRTRQQPWYRGGSGSPRGFRE